MPVDPQTGNRLPYEGEPGYEEAKKQFPELYAAEEGGGEEPEMPGDEGPADAEAMEETPIPEDGIVPERDLKPMMDQADEILAEGEGAEEGGEAPEGEEAATEGVTSDIQPLMEMLGMSEERAQEILDAAQSIPKYAEMESDELAELISGDFQVLMELERAAAQLAKPEEQAPMPEAGMPAGMPPDMGGPAGEPTM
mgnify:CR=1 FL=1